MRHLKIQFLGHLNVARPRWPSQTFSPHVEFEVQYETEPLLSVEIDKRSWDEMFDLYEAHLNGYRHPAVQDAWQQYQTVLRLCNQQDFAGTKKL